MRAPTRVGRFMTFAVALLAIAMISGTAVALTTWAPLPGAARTLEQPKTCTTYGSVAPGNPCVSGGVFLDGNTSFATSFNDTTNEHWRHASWAADRGSGNAAIPLVPYSASGCLASSNPEQQIALTGTSASVDFGSNNNAVATSSALIPSNTAALVLQAAPTRSGQIATFDLTTAHGWSAGNVVRVAGVVNTGADAPTGWDGDFEIIDAAPGGDNTRFTVDLLRSPGTTITAFANDGVRFRQALPLPVNPVRFDNATGANIESADFVGTTGIFATTEPIPGSAPAGGVNQGDLIVTEGVTVAGVMAGTQYNSVDAGVDVFKVTSVDSPTTFQVTMAGTPTAPSDPLSGALLVRRGTWTVTAHPFVPGDAIDTDGFTGGSAGWGSPGTGSYQAWTVQSTTANTVSANINNSGLTLTTGRANRFVVTVTTTGTAHGLTVGAFVTIAGTGGKADGRWPVVAVDSATAFKVTIDTTTIAKSGGSTSKPPYCESVYYSRSSNGSTWSTPQRISTPANSHAEFYALAASGPNVYVVFAPTVGYYNQMCSGSPRPMYVQWSTDYGATWQVSPTLLTASDSRIGYPVIAASENNVYIATTETADGVDPRVGQGIVSVWSNTTAGSGAWTKRTVGATTSTSDWGYAPGGCPAPATTVMGFEPMPGIAAAGDYAGVIFMKNNSGRAIIKVSKTQGATWSTGCGEGATTSAANMCTQIPVTKGAKGVYTNTAQSCPGGGGSADPEVSGACGGGVLTAAGAGDDTDPDGNSARFAFGWVNAECQGGSVFVASCPGPGPGTPALPNSNGIPPGMYTKVWTSAGWQQTQRIACFENTRGSCDGLAGTTYPAGYMDGYSQQISWFGTDDGTAVPTGVALTWIGCPDGPAVGKGCSEVAADPGARIIMKESGNTGVSWGGDWGVNPSSYNVVATQTGNAAYQINEYPQVLYYDPTDNTGTDECAQETSAALAGRGTTSCKKLAFFMSRNTSYTLYAAFQSTGTIT